MAIGGNTEQVAFSKSRLLHLLDQLQAESQDCITVYLTPASLRRQTSELAAQLGAMPEEMKEKILDLRGVKVPGEETSDVVRRLVEEDNQVQAALDILTGWQILSNSSP